MAPKKHIASKAVPQQPEPWQAAQSRRLGEKAKARARGPQPSMDLFRAAAAEDVQVFPSGEPVAPEFVARRSADEAALMMHRFTGEGLMKSGFEPQRHSVIVAGRPTQVPMIREFHSNHSWISNKFDVFFNTCLGCSELPSLGLAGLCVLFSFSV